jgi:hypothetical protein
MRVIPVSSQAFQVKRFKASNEITLLDRNNLDGRLTEKPAV